MNTRFGAPAALTAAVLLVAATASAQGPYSLTARAATGAGATVRLPATGVPCTDITGSFAKIMGQNQTYRQPASKFMAVVLNPAGCIPGSAASISTTGSGGFTLPPNFFTKPATMFNVVPVPANNAVPQLATSFNFYGPGATGMTMGYGPNMSLIEPLSPRKSTTPKFTPAVRNVFRANAHLTPAGSTYGTAISMKFVAGEADHTAGSMTTPSMGSYSHQVRVNLNKYVSGRTSANFTACPQPMNMASAVACTFATQGTIRGVVKNIASDRVFGGTMGLMLNTFGSTNTSNLGQTVNGGYNSAGGMNTMATRGSIVFPVLMGNGTRAAGRGYAVYDTDNLYQAAIFTMHKLTTIQPGMFNEMLVGMVTFVGGIQPMLPAGTNRNHGFPWTTGTQIIRGTGKTLNGGPGDGTFSLMGYDNRMTPSGATGMGGEGNIQLVAGAISAALPLQPYGGTANYTVMRFEFAPEPRAAVGLLAGAMAVFGLVAWSRRRR